MTRLSHFLVLAALATVTSARAAELPAEIKQAGVLKLTVNSTYAPMEYRDPASNELVGLDIDLANELARRLGGLKIVWSETPSPALKRTSLLTGAAAAGAHPQAARAIATTSAIRSRRSFFVLIEMLTLRRLVGPFGGFLHLPLRNV